MTPPAFQVHLGNFDGPFDLLLSLIHKHQLDVTEVALSQVTDEFLAHVQGMGAAWELDQATEFLVVAATLLDLKAARLLPAAEVEDEEDLALLEARDLLFARLLQYRAYKQVTTVLAEMMRRQDRLFPRSVPLEPHLARLMPDVVLDLTPDRFAALAERVLASRPPAVAVDHVHVPQVSVSEQAEQLARRLRVDGVATFAALTTDCATTLEVVARFLALLDLFRSGRVTFDQGTPLGELRVRWAEQWGIAVPGEVAGHSEKVPDEHDEREQEQAVETR